MMDERTCLQSAAERDHVKEQRKVMEKLLLEEEGQAPSSMHIPSMYHVRRLYCCPSKIRPGLGAPGIHARLMDPNCCGVGGFPRCEECAAGEEEGSVGRLGPVCVDIVNDQVKYQYDTYESVARGVEKEKIQKNGSSTWEVPKQRVRVTKQGTISEILKHLDETVEDYLPHYWEDRFQTHSHKVVTNTFDKNSIVMNVRFLHPSPPIPRATHPHPFAATYIMHAYSHNSFPSPPPFHCRPTLLQSWNTVLLVRLTAPPTRTRTLK